MKKCRECGRTIEEKDEQYNPATELGDMYLQSTDSDSDDVCDECKEESGILNLLGFEE